MLGILGRFEVSLSMNAPSAINGPAYWRQRADEARRLAELTDPADEQAMQEVVTSYQGKPLQNG